MSTDRKPLVWLTGQLADPPVGREAKREAGFLLHQLQVGVRLGMPHSRPMPDAGKRVHELRIRDAERSLTWRIFYRLDSDAIIVPHWFAKKDEQTSKADIARCERRLKAYDQALAEAGKAATEAEKATRRTK